MRTVWDGRILFRYLALVSLSVLLVGCGNGSDVEPLDPTQPPATTASTPEEDNEGGGGNIITRSLRTGGGWVWSGITWIWDRGSDGVNAVWDGINSVSSFLWDTVRGLPSNVWEQIQRFWNWVWGTNVGGAVLTTVQSVPELIAKLNPVGFLQNLISLLGRVLLFGVVLALIGFLLAIIYKFRVIDILRRLFFRRVQRSRPRLQSWNPEDAPAQRVVVEVQQPTAQPPSIPAPQEASAPTSTAPGSGVPTMWSRAQIRELKALVSNPTIVALFEMARRRDGGPVNYRELIHSTGLDASEVGAHFSAFFRKARAVHKDDEWPIEIVTPTDEDSKRAYFIPKPYLDWWFER